MRRIISKLTILVVVVLWMACLAACGGAGGSSAASGSFASNASGTEPMDLSKMLGSKDAKSVAAQLSGLRSVEIHPESSSNPTVNAFETTEGIAEPYFDTSAHTFEMQSDEDAKRLKDDFALVLGSIDMDATTVMYALDLMDKTYTISDIEGGSVPEMAMLVGICTEELTPEEAAEYLERYTTIDQCVISDEGGSIRGNFKTGDMYGTVSFKIFVDNKTNQFSKYKVEITAVAYPEGSNGSERKKQADEYFRSEYDKAQSVEGKVYKR